MLNQRILYRTISVVLALLTAIATTPVSAAELAEPMGSVSAGGTVELRGVRISREGTLFAGDVIRSHAGGYAKISLSVGHQIELGANTVVTFDEGLSVVQLAMASGSIAFTAAGISPLRIDIAPYELSMTDAGSGSVVLAGTETIGVRSTTGSLSVKNTETQELFVLSPGQVRQLGRTNGVVAPSLGDIASTIPGPIPTAPLPSAPVPAPQAGSALLGGAAWGALVAAIGGGAAVAGYLLGRQGTVDESELTAAQAATAAANVNLAAANVNLAAANLNLAAAVAARDVALAQLASHAHPCPGGIRC